mgnify:CR=1 FL=1
MKIIINHSSMVPIYEQLIEQIKAMILNEELKTARVANAISGSSDDSYEAKMRINQLVREIDKCIALLNN